MKSSVLALGLSLAGCLPVADPYQAPTDSPSSPTTGGSSSGTAAGAMSDAASTESGAPVASEGGAADSGNGVVGTEDATADVATADVATHDVAVTEDAASGPLDGGVNGVPPGYAGTPFKGTPLTIPGTIHLSDYDIGGPGVAYCHGNESACSSGIVTGDWRPAGTPMYRPLSDNAGLCHMNSSEPDNTTTGELVMPEDVYVCYTATKEWLKFTVNVTDPGTYAIGGQFASPGGVTVSLDFGAGTMAGPFAIPASPTQSCKCPETYHSWQVVQNLATITLSPGTYVMTFTLRSGTFNPDYFTFTKM